ncbi:thiamine phosphate synthase [Legionella waltersii]|uniref:Thiamine-phosphate synthase n=1 Tax=Legionella waltersii TaxID=66969 RepID=A0A0W1A5F9_9GAMM|nr:thiamine phosphate synthase [Legionella waltersii]KTD76599.1 bifunctional phosphomethylpyrimidine kinase ThiD/thiamin- phosphate pyrophosphorylase ThiE [Legionella waltersii]SNU94561.1 phosphomethylpyrimidine kinase ThiD/thiamin-phosphate pyrophosphorylase fused protein ThiE [Legionella waltersii]
MNLSHLRLCLVTQFNDQRLGHYLRFLALAIEGGVTSVQLRDKSRSLANLRRLALAIQSFLTPLQIPLIINDHVQLAKEINADGVHIGQTDLSPHETRTILGPNKIIGYSVETLKDLKKANELSCIDYVAASAVFASPSKPDCKTIWGLDGLKRVSKLSKHPVVAIGGITHHNTAEVIRHGAYGIAVISAIHGSPDPLMAAKELSEKIKEGKKDVPDHH